MGRIGACRSYYNRLLREGGIVDLSLLLAPDARSRNGLFCVPWARCTRAVAPCLLCEELAVILVIGGGCGASAHPCEASALGLWSLGSSRPSTRPVGGGAGPGLPGPAHLDTSLLPAWCLVLGPGFLVCRLPSVSLPWVGSVGRFVYVSTF